MVSIKLLFTFGILWEKNLDWFITTTAKTEFFKWNFRDEYNTNVNSCEFLQLE